MPSAKKTSAKKTTTKTPAKKTAANKLAARKTARAMPAFTKAPPALVAGFQQAVAGLPLVEERRMFGYPAAFSNGQMFASLFGDHMILRLPAAERQSFIEQHHSRLFEPMPGRPMKEYVEVPPALLASAQPLDDWLRKALAYAQSLPAKAGKGKRKS